MAPKFELLFFDVDEEVGFTAEEDSPGSDDVAPLWVPDAEPVAPEAPSTAPGACSGESPTAKDLFEFQLFSDVISMRAHWGTRVPEGTGLGNDEGGRVFVQLDEYSGQVVHTAPWHASHALMSEYVTVLHLHKLVSSTPVGPMYEYPGFRASIVNEPPLHVAIRYAATVHAFWSIELNVHSHVKLQSGA